MAELDRHHRLHVQDVDRRILLAGIEVEVALERQADEVGHRVLGLLGEIALALCPDGGGRQRRREQQRRQSDDAPDRAHPDTHTGPRGRLP
jgi:hypothetical protein